MSKKDETVPDPLGQEDGGFGVFKPPARKTSSPASKEKKPATSSSLSARPDSDQSATAASDGGGASVWSTSAAPSAGMARPPASVPVHASAPLPDSADHFMPTSVTIGAQLAIHLEYYQSKVRSKTGKEPSITVVLLEALNHCYDEDLATYREIINKRRQPPALATSGPFTGAAARRRAATGSRMIVQLPIRPTKAETDMIDDFSSRAGAKSRSEFLDGVLEHFLMTVAQDMPKTFKPKRQMGTLRSPQG